MLSIVVYKYIEIPWVEPLPPTMRLRFHDNGRRFDRAAVFAGAAADAKFRPDAGPVLFIRIDGMLRALLLAEQAKLSLGPAQAARMIDFRQTHQHI